MYGIPLFPNLLTHIHACIYGITHNYVTRSEKTSIIATMTEIHFLGSVSGSYIQALPRNTKYRIRQNFRGGKLSRLCTKHTIHWKTFAVHQAHAIMYCTQQVIQGENFRGWLKTAKTTKVFPLESFAVYGT